MVGDRLQVSFPVVDGSVLVEGRFEDDVTKFVGACGIGNSDSVLQRCW
jgi:hypothetical protein